MNIVKPVMNVVLSIYTLKNLSQRRYLPTT